MKMTITGLPESLSEEYQTDVLGRGFLIALHSMNIPVDGVRVQFEKETE